MRKVMNNPTTGKFSTVGGRELFGSLHICGDASRVVLFDNRRFSPAPDSYGYITGQLHDGRLVSLIQGTLMGTKGRSSETGSWQYSAEVFPHFVAIGPMHVPVSEPSIERISFAMEDAAAIFYDFDAFSTVLNTEPFLPLLKEATEKYREVEFGEHPIIGYFTGKFEIAAVDTILGEVRAEHRPSMTSGGPKGVRIDNTVTLVLTPSNPITFNEAIWRLSTLLRFFELIAGRFQPLSGLAITLAGQSDRSSPIDVYRSFTPQPRTERENDKVRRPHPADVLISTRDNSGDYSTILKNYLESESDRLDARARLHNQLVSHGTYTIDRLVAAANVFDILPDTVYPDREPISSELTTATEEARRLFRALPDSLERSSVLGALGRVGTLSLKHKIRYRVTSTGLDKKFPGILDVLKEAVNCRNHYVHGTQSRIDYSKSFDVVCFFTDALEFTFAASDLIDAGWSLDQWMSSRPGQSHPFGVFAAQYNQQKESLMGLLRT